MTGDSFVSLRQAVEDLTGRWILGFSGGADSTALLLLLKEFSRTDVTAVHVHHGLRGEAANEDLAFCERLCSREGIPLQAVHLHPPANPGEAWAREARYEALSACAQACGAEGLLTAHHARDQAETLLMHLARGSGLKGLCGMRRETNLKGLRVLRPLLQVPPEELRAYLQARNQTWREDESNQSRKWFRNRIRLELLPALEATAPGATLRMAAAAWSLQEDEACLSELSQDWLRTHGAGRCLPISRLKELPAAIRSRVLRQCAETYLAASSDREQTQAMSRLLNKDVGSQLTLGQGRIYRGYLALHFIGEQKAEAPQPVSPVDGAELLGVRLKLSPGQGSPGDGKRCQELPPEALEGCLLRTWQPGDWIRPFGMRGQMTLQDWFVNRKVDQPWRNEIPLLCRGSEVLLVAGLGAGNLPRWTEGCVSLQLSWEGNLPWLQLAEQEEGRKTADGSACGHL